MTLFPVGLPGRHVPGHLTRLLLWPGLLLFASAQLIQAQGPPEPPPGAWPSQRPLHTGHWSHEFLEVLAALGFAGAWTGWVEPIPAASVQDLLESVAGSVDSTLAAGDGEPGSGAVVDVWGRALAGELGTRPDGEAARFVVSVGGGVDSGPEGLLEERDGAFGLVGGDVRLGRSVGIWGAGSVASQGEGMRLDEGGVSVALGPLQVLGGRIRVGLGQGDGRMVSGGRPAMDGVLLASRAPFRLPGFLRHLGPVSFQVFGAPRFHNADGFDSWFGSAGFSLSPHPRVQIGMQRTARFAGEGIADWDWGDFWDMLVGRSGDNPFDDSQGEIDVRVRWPFLDLEVTTYASLGFEDAPSIYEDPGIVAGALVPWSMGLGVLALRYEYGAFGRRAMWCGWCDYRTHNWYADREYGTYGGEDAFLGSDLGGYGSAHRVGVSFWSGWRGAPAVRGEVRLFREHRLEENRLRDRWPGVRKGIRLEAAVRPRSAWEVSGEGEVASYGDAVHARGQVAVRLFRVGGFRDP
jgi:hypothetical protein